MLAETHFYDQYYFVYHYRVFGSFVLEATLATAFGRRVDIQKGESDEFSKAMDTLMTGFGDGELEQFLVFNSKLMWHFKFAFPS